MRPLGARPVVLVVDDDTAVRESLHLVLDDDFEVLEAADGTAAIEIATRAPVDVVLLDILMPGPDGITTLGQLQDARPGLPVVVLSGLDRSALTATALRYGAADYVTKPFQDEMLLRALRNALRRGGPDRPAVSGPPVLATIGCEMGLVAAVGATLAHSVETRSYVEPPDTETLVLTGPPAVLVVETQERGLDWLGRAAVLLDRLPDTPAVILLHASRPEEARFALGGRGCMLERPFAVPALLDLICSVLPEPPVSRPWRDARLARVIERAALDCSSLRLRPLAQQAGVSPWHLSRRFREVAGLPLSMYLTLVRLRAASYLIEHTDAKLDAVAARLGFHDASHLSRAFVRLTGRRPGEIRQSRNR
jgi:CheY-like chemotaxis protein/AraC-like DNA-binding protein